MPKRKPNHLYKFKFREDGNFHIYYDTETSPIYFIQDNDYIEKSTIISVDEYKEYQKHNNMLVNKKKEPKYKIGSYQVTKMATIDDEQGNKNIFIVKDKNCKYDLPEFDGIEITYFKNSEDLKKGFWDLIDMYIESIDDESVKIRIFAHNQMFDIKQIGFFGNKDIKIDDSKYGGACLSKPFFVSIIYKGQSIRFEDSMNFFNSSLKKLGDDIGLKKLDFEFEFNAKELIIDEDCIGYGMRDTEIIKKAIEDFRNEIISNELGSLSVSIAGTAFNIYRTSFNPNNIYLNENEEVTRDEIKCKHGGRTEAFKIGVYRDIYYYDVNSLYPWCMKQILPREYVRTAYNRTKNNDYLDDDVIRFVLDSKLKYGIYLVDIDTEEPNIPNFVDGRLCFVKGNLKDKLLHEAEFKYFYNSDKYNVKVKKIHIYKAGKIMKKYVEYFEKMKIENNDNPTKRQLAKNMLNNLYGKFGQFNRESYIENFEDENLFIGREIRIEDQKEFLIDCFGTFGLKTFEDKDSKSINAFPAIAGAITSYARMKLLEGINEVGKENVIYCDTDSIMTSVKLSNEFIHQKEFGKWKLENTGIIKGFEKRNNLKCDNELISVLIKGLKNYIIFKTINGVNHCIEIKSKGVKKTAEELQDNLYLQKRFWTIKTSKLKHETLFTLNNTVIMDEYKRNTNKISKGKVKKSRNNEIDILFKEGFKKVKYVNADVEAFNDEDLNFGDPL